mgnify:CR=1 FL=1
MPPPHATARRDSPRAPLLVEQLGDASPAPALLALQCRIQIRSSRITEGQDAPLVQGLKPRRYRRIDLSLPRWQELSHNLSPIGDQDPLSRETHAGPA